MTVTIEQCVAERQRPELEKLLEGLAAGLKIKAAAPTRQEPHPMSAGQIALGRPETNSILRQIAAYQEVPLLSAGTLPASSMVSDNPNIEIARNIAAARAVKVCSNSR